MRSLQKHGNKVLRATASILLMATVIGVASGQNLRTHDILVEEIAAVQATHGAVVNLKNDAKLLAPDTPSIDLVTSVETNQRMLMRRNMNRRMNMKRKKNSDSKVEDCVPLDRRDLIQVGEAAKPPLTGGYDRRFLKKSRSDKSDKRRKKDGRSKKGRAPTVFCSEAPSMAPVDGAAEGAAAPGPDITDAVGTGGSDNDPVLQPFTFPPTPSPTREPTASPTYPPTRNPTVSPTSAPTSSPTSSPTSNPTVSPTSKPTSSPTGSPTLAPTESPTVSPTSNPTHSPTSSPTFIPTASPTSAPTNLPTASPTSSPTKTPTTPMPTSKDETKEPTKSPTKNPTVAPTKNPTPSPTGAPTKKPTLALIESPSAIPSASPTEPPSDAPSSWPSSMPTDCGYFYGFVTGDEEVFGKHVDNEDFMASCDASFGYQIQDELTKFTIENFGKVTPVFDQDTCVSISFTHDMEDDDSDNCSDLFLALVYFGDFDKDAMSNNFGGFADPWISTDFSITVPAGQYATLVAQSYFTNEQDDEGSPCWMEFAITWDGLC